ncbi:MAG: hypothetical protein ACXABI_08100 [Candidatus Hodarchaeales archaeon]|jgi:hypothetical protein
MENLKDLQKYGSLESFALDQTEEFLRPKTFLDYIFTLGVIFWLITAVILTENLSVRATIFGILILLFLIIPFSKYFIQQDVDIPSPLNRAMKILIAFIIIDIFGPTIADDELWDQTLLSLSYVELETLFACLLTPFSIIWNRFNPTTLHLGYFHYIGEIFRGVWTASLVTLILRGFSVLTIPQDFLVELESLLILGLGFNIVGLILPRPLQRTQYSIDTLLKQSLLFKTRIERVRDGFLSTSIILLIFLWLPNWIINQREFIEYSAFILLIIGILLLISPQKRRTNGIGTTLRSLTGNLIDPSSQIGNRVQNFAETIQQTSFEKPNRVFTIPSDDLKIFSKGKTSVSARKGSIAVPTVTDKGTTLVLMGQSEIQTEDEKQEVQTKNVEGTTTIWVPPEEWNEMKVQLESKEINELTETELIKAGLDSTTDLYNKANRAISQLRNWKGPQNLFSSVFDTSPSKYAVTETKDYTYIRLPGILVYERKGINLVQILGGLVQVVDIKGVGEYVKILGGLVTVMQTPDYEFVQTPFVSVLETPVGEVVKVFGIKIQEGEKIDMDQARHEILGAQERFNRLFTNQVENLFENNIPNLLLSNSKGEQEGFLLGESEAISDKTFRPTRKRKVKAHRYIQEFPKKDTSIELKSKIKSNHYVEKEEFHEVKIGSEYEYDEDGYPINHPEINSIEEELSQIKSSLEKMDEKFLNDEVSEQKHEEIVGRLKDKKDRLLKKKSDLSEKHRLKFLG